MAGSNFHYKQSTVSFIPICRRLHFAVNFEKEICHLIEDIYNLAEDICHLMEDFRNLAEVICHLIAYLLFFG